MTNVDLSYLESVTDGDKVLIKELVDIFKNQIPVYLSDFKDALDQKDVEELGRIAHKSKSSVAIMGMGVLANELDTFESESKEGVFLDKFPSYILSFEKHCKEAMLILDRML